jgi:hypothetical protein
MAGTQYWGTARWGATQNVGYSATAGTISNGIGSGAYKVRLICTTAAFVRVGDNPTATASDVYVAAGIPEYVTITPGQKVSAVQVASAGTLYVTECS